MVFFTTSELIGIGIGTDLVYIPSFGDQLLLDGTHFASVFTDREWAYCLTRDGVPASVSDPGPRALESLAARWATKEAAVKAWSTLISPEASPLDPATFNWAEIEVIHDRHNRPLLRFHGDVAQELSALETRCGGQLVWAASFTHERNYASANVHLTAIRTAGAEDPPISPRPTWTHTSLL